MNSFDSLHSTSDNLAVGIGIIEIYKIRQTFWRAILNLPKFDGSDYHVSAWQDLISVTERLEFIKIRKLLFNPLLWPGVANTSRATIQCPLLCDNGPAPMDLCRTGRWE